MRTSISNLNGAQQNVLNHLSKNLRVALYPMLIICYGHRSGTTFRSSSFSNTGIEKINWSAFDLVIVIRDEEVLPDSMLLETAKNCFKTNSGNQVMICRMKEVLKDFEFNNRFFSTVFRKGILLYAEKNALNCIPHPLPPAGLISKKTEIRLAVMIRHARQCLVKAGEGLDDCSSDPLLVMLLLNESAVYTARYFIAANCDIEINGGLDKLLDFSLNINNALTDILPRNTVEEKILFHVLNLSFIEQGFYPDAEVIHILFKRMCKMMAISQVHAQRKIAELVLV